MLFILLGPLEIIAGVIAIVIEATGSSIDKIVGYTLGITLIVAGILSIVAGLRRYRGGWRTLAGSLICILAFPALAANVNAHLFPDYVRAFRRQAGRFVLSSWSAPSLFRTETPCVSVRE
jgi:uncharacterized membrane protein HdeD (DUF308 family)